MTDAADLVRLRLRLGRTVPAFYDAMRTTQALSDWSSTDHQEDQEAPMPPRSNPPSIASGPLR